MKHVILFSLALAALAGGCTPPTHFRNPSGFVTIDDDDYDQRATNSDGVVIGVRAMDNDPEGDLSFWSGVIDRRLREHYDAVDVREVESSAGEEGVQIRYETVVGGRLHRYWATIFVQGDRVFLVEAGGDAELFDQHVQAVEEAVLSVDLG
jgi:hypothetical protein